MLLRNVFAAAVAVMMGAATLAAQETTLALYLHGGAQSPTTDLDRNGSARWDGGFHFGGGAALGVHPNVAFRAEVTLARGDATSPVLDQTEFTRLFYGADLVVRHPRSKELPRWWTVCRWHRAS